MGDIVQRFDATPENLLGLYELVYKLRAFETEVVKQYKDGKIYGGTHAYIGEEAVASGACFALKPGDKIWSTHRGHGHAIAKGVDPKEVMA